MPLKENRPKELSLYKLSDLLSEKKVYFINSDLTLAKCWEEAKTYGD